MPSDSSLLATTVTKLLTKGTDELDKTLLKSVKGFCKSSDDHVATTMQTTLRLLRRKHSQVRFACVQLADELFMRSALFRKLLVGAMGEVLLLCFGNENDGEELPPPREWSHRLVRLAAACIAKWHAQFGSMYGQLLVAMQTAQPAVARIASGDAASTAADGAQTSTDTAPLSRESRTHGLRLEKYRKLRDGFESLSADVAANLTQLASIIRLSAALDILVPNLEIQQGTDPHTQNQQQQRQQPAMYGEMVREYALGNVSYSLSISVPKSGLVQETPDTQPLFDSIRESVALMDKSHARLVAQWIDTVAKADDPDRRSHESFLKRLIDMKRGMTEALAKARELLKTSPTADKEPKITVELDETVKGMHENNEEEEEEEEEEDEVFVDVEPDATGPPVEPRPVPAAEQPDADRATETEEYILAPNPDEADLLAVAPVVPYGADLDFWDRDEVFFHEVSSHAGLEFHHRFLGDGPSDRLLSEDAIKALRKRRVYASVSGPETIMACRAPLRSGKLCMRRDLVRCPVHGPIIPSSSAAKPASRIPPNRDRFLAISLQASSASRPAAKSRSSRPQQSKRPQSAWELIEGDVAGTLGLQPYGRGRKRETALVDLTKKPNPIRRRLARTSKRLAKRSAGGDGDPDEAELAAKVKDRNLNRW
ncbi:hypothetical protein BC831DRAFT_401059 [Entophlyctis helioformis]|nr:hypothetical protein BC831DRAFT_401059 [Entophlyctis helioformis]